MAFRIVLPRQMNVNAQTAEAENRFAPRHAVSMIARELNATIYEPCAESGSLADKVRAKILPTESLWALARRVKSESKSGDVIFCPSEAGGMQMAAIYGKARTRPRIAVFTHNVDRPRTKLAMRFWRMDHKIDVFLACSQYQAEFLRAYLRLPDNRVRHIWDHTDNEFFSPGKQKRNSRPLIASVGLEQRDYRTLAIATETLNVDVKISGFSKDSSINKRALPDALPENMTASFYEWKDLVQLYRDADIVVVSCFENKYAAGVQSLMEAASCARPIVVTATQGLKNYIDNSMISVEPENANAMRNAIVQLLSDAEAAEIRAKRSHEFSRQHFEMNRYVSDITSILRSMS
jgi:glycosyltransferase involved in cell wall biosynthesis